MKRSHAKPLGTSLLFTLALAGCATPPPGAITDSDQLPVAYIEAYRNGDAARIAALFADDATFVPLLPMARFQGREAVRAYYQRAIGATTARNITPTQQTVQDYGDVVVRSADIRIDQTFADGRQVATPARVSFVYRRDGGQWRIVHHHQSVMPAPPASAPAR